MWKKIQRKELVLKHGEFFGGFLSKGVMALSNNITCQTVFSVDDSPALIILPYFISCLEHTLTVLVWFLLSVNLWVMLLLECWVSRKIYILDEACLNTVTADNPLNHRGKLTLLKKKNINLLRFYICSLRIRLVICCISSMYAVWNVFSTEIIIIIME